MADRLAMPVMAFVADVTVMIRSTGTSIVSPCTKGRSEARIRLDL
jgi:hypothetical protein